MSVNPLSNRASYETVPPSLQNLASGLTEKQMQYRAVYHHWFFCREVEAKILWLPFSMHDSLNLEEVHNSNEISPDTKVATDGGRYDVEILRRQRASVYWSSPVSEVRRCSWFYKGPAESRYTPYDESIAARLEEEFKQACLSNNWNRRVDLNNGEYIVFHSANVQVHYLQATTPELAASWGNNSQGSEDNAYLQGATSRPRVVKRGMDEFNIDDGEPEKVDHLLFLVHGIGSVCDLKFRTVEEVDEFRSISLQLVQSHYRNSSERGIVNRIEVLPISWHAALHSGIDKKLQVITLGSIPKLRHFTNDTLLDILFYTSPTYCETIMQTVGNQLNQLYALFNERNPNFQGNVYLGGHSLGSLIVFDLLCHQKPPVTEEISRKTEDNKDADNKVINSQDIPIGPVLKRKLSKQVSYVMGTAGTGQPYINYPQLVFNPSAFFALGSPIGMFVTVRGIDTLGEDFVLPTCPAFFNIFHPFDPVAYRIESLINPDAYKYRPMLIPHHKGRKRMHLELKETMARVGADLKQKLLESVKSTWNSVYQLGIFNRQDNKALQEEIEKVVEEQMINSPSENVEATATDDAGFDLKIGKLNGGRRVDYVLQEAPFEYINEYLFILTSHVCYWQSEDTMLMMLKEIYGSMGIQTDAQLPQQTLSIERVSGSPSNIIPPTGTFSLDSMEQIAAQSVTSLPTTSFIKNS
ncbi:PREDICTED: SEC23-interacting protein isoform X2 [Ceratosolen solmsi marchali]|uniref:SEC23-interacting protein isoform X2 n=1 Tax=Ceratosolen solmsi marchali TaxID=326594 RepID=A0AAJ7E240_9HYME|nr:PREDICTED: SEC23-interacting protein isoform X2 [Ceratosolen solmsi marchali]